MGRGVRLRACWEGLCGARAERPGWLRQRGGLWAPGAPARLRCVMNGGWGMVGGAHPEPQAPMHPLALALRPTEAHRSSRSASTACAPTPDSARLLTNHPIERMSVLPSCCSHLAARTRGADGDGGRRRGLLLSDMLDAHPCRQLHRTLHGAQCSAVSPRPTRARSHRRSPRPARHPHS